MAQIARMENQVDIKSSAERFFQTYCNKQNLMPKIIPNVVKDVQLIKGDSYSVGSVTKWTFASPSSNSSSEIASVVTEAIDEKNNSTTFSVIDGDLKKLYTHYKVTVQTGNKPGGSGSFVKCTIEYEKLNADIPDPAMYFDFAALLFKGLDAYLVNNP